jgi:hypothetical protein
MDSYHGGDEIGGAGVNDGWGESGELRGKWGVFLDGGLCHLRLSIDDFRFGVMALDWIGSRRRMMRSSFFIGRYENEECGGWFDNRLLCLCLRGGAAGAGRIGRLLGV